MKPRALLPILLATVGLADAAETARAPRDPFALPAIATAPPPAPPRTAVPVAAAIAATPEPAWNPPVHALMAAGRRSMANVGGVLLGLGDSVDGWRLTAVTENEAVFVKRGRRTVLRLEREKELQKP